MLTTVSAHPPGSKLHCPGCGREVVVIRRESDQEPVLPVHNHLTKAERARMHRKSARWVRSGPILEEAAVITYLEATDITERNLKVLLAMGFTDESGFTPIRQRLARG